MSDAELESWADEVSVRVRTARDALFQNDWARPALEAGEQAAHTDLGGGSFADVEVYREDGEVRCCVCLDVPCPELPPD
jgi:hypothetical protein